MTDHHHYMRLAITKAREGIRAGQSPFGACIVSAAGRVLACEHNVVWQTTDATAHAEVNAIRTACRAANDIKLTGATIYSTTEPCPMCFAAIHWAGLKRIVFGSSIPTARSAGFSELSISNQDMRRLGQSPVEITPAFLEPEADQLFKEWQSDPARRVY